MLISEEVTVDVLVVGAGGAGLRSAIKAREAGAKVAVACLGSGSSDQIVAFNVPLGHGDSRDNPDIYYRDTMAAGRHINNSMLVETLVRQSLNIIPDLEKYGFNLERDSKGAYRQKRLGGSKHARSVYCSDRTGYEILNCMKAYLKRSGFLELDGVRILTLVTMQGRVIGAVGIHIERDVLIFIAAKSVILASGGVGRLYGDSTYPLDVVGDSYGLALRAGAQLVDMEFVQFEPTVCFTPDSLRGLEMPTAMFADGATLRNSEGIRFLANNHPFCNEVGLEKAVMAKHIFEEIRSGKGSPNLGVYFDTTEIPERKLSDYPRHLERLQMAGIDPRRQCVEVKPMAHSHMGGIEIDVSCWTGIPGLYAAGEACGGVHGASRIAGNSGSEILVFGAIAGTNAANFALSTASAVSKVEFRKAAEKSLAALHSTASYLSRNDAGMLENIQVTMSKCAGLVREAPILKGALEPLQRKPETRSGEIEDPKLWASLAHGVYVSRAILEASLLREESRGAHNRADFPEEEQTWEKNIYFSLDEAGELKHRVEPARNKTTLN